MREGMTRTVYLSDEAWEKLSEIGERLRRDGERPSRSNAIRKMIDQQLKKEA